MRQWLRGRWCIGGLDFDDIDIAATSVSGLSAVIPVTVGGTTKYVPCYDSYA